MKICKLFISLSIGGGKSGKNIDEDGGLEDLVERDFGGFISILRKLNFIIVLIMSQRKLGVSLCLILILVQIHSEALQLFSASTSPTQVIPPYGSVRGGTTLYIRGLGFNTNANENQIFVGTYPCLIPADGATETTLACVTSDSGQLNNIYYLPIIVISNGQQQQLTNQQGSFSYLASVTPVVEALYPASAIPGTYVNFYGIHRISDLGDGQRNLGDVISMKIGDSQCSRFDILQGPISPSGYATISCNQASVQEAGKYAIVEHVVPGYSAPGYRLRRTSFLAENFHFAVLPSVSAVTPNYGAEFGQKITIKGSGFTTNASLARVSVDGNQCNVVSTSMDQIVCNLPERNSSVSAQIGTNSGGQVNGYFSGSGLKYQRFDITNLGTKTPAGLRSAIQVNSTTITLVESGYRGEIKTGSYYGSYYGQAFTGYFTAPATGTYSFQGVADDSFAVYLQTSPYGSAEPAPTPLLYSDSVQNDNFYLSYRASAEANVTLQAGESYYIEVYHINGAGDGFLRVAAAVPNTDTSLLWQTHTVQKLQLSFTNDPEIVQFTQTGGTSGQINLTIITRVLGKPPTVEFAVIDFNASSSAFVTAITSLSPFKGYQATGTRQTYDENNTITSDPALTKKYVWTLTIPLVRSTAQTTTTITPVYVNYAETQSFTQTIVHPHGPLISGSFELNINGNVLTYGGTTALPASISAGNLASAFRAVAGFGNVQVNLISDSNYQAYGATWIITYYGINGVLPDLVANPALLQGGQSGTSPQMSSSTLRYYSSQLLFDPIDFTLLNTPSDKPNVLVTIKDIPSVCTGDCRYTFLVNSPVVTSSAISGAVVTLSLTDPASVGFTLDQVTVTIGGQPCTIVNPGTSSISNFQCQLPANADSTPTIEAGSYMPEVEIAELGMAPCLPAVTPFAFPLTLTALNLTSGGSNGGYSLLLTGTGFPLNSEGATITICGVEATILSMTNTQAEIIMPQCAIGSEDIVIATATGSSNALQFNYVAPAPSGFIYAVSPQSYNPALKGVMNITGVGFGTDPAALRVDLANSSGKVYPMRILSLNDTFIKVGIPGGLEGDYKVQVNIIGLGELLPNASSVNDFTYELVITSISPSSGSYYGGTLINIKGINFSPALDQTLVFVGTELNWFCAVELLNTTDILCRTPQASQYYNISQPQTVYLENRLMADNTCNGTCQFSYLPSSASPSLTAISANTIATGQITLSGTLLDSSPPSVVLTNKETGVVTVVTPASYNSSQIVFVMPSVEGGNYNVKARIDPIGETNAFLLKVTTAMSSVTPSSISSEGAKVTVSGSGLPASWPNSNFVLKITAGNTFVQPSILGTSPTSLTLSLPALPTSSTVLISLTTPLGTTVSKSISVQSSSTPQLSLSSSSSSVAGSISFTFTKANLLSASPAYVEVYSLFDGTEIHNVSIPAQAVSSSVAFSAGLPGGLFGFRFYYVQYGFAQCSDNKSISISKPSIPALVSSYNGREFTITGGGLSSSATISVGGFKTKLSNIGSSSATATVPALVTELTQRQYTLSSPQKLARNQFTIISDSAATNENAFDSTHGTIYSSSSSSTCYIGVDVGSQLLINLTRIRFFPNSRWTIVANYLVGATLQASVDGTSYDVIATIDSSVHSGWNVKPLALGQYYRFVRFSHDQVSQCQLAEFEVQGIMLSKVSLASLGSNMVDIVYEDGANRFTYTGGVEFREDHTGIVRSLSSTTGDVFGRYDLTITGTYLNFDNPTVTIDGITCTIKSSNSTTIVCEVGPRLTLPDHNSFVVKIGQNNPLIYQSFTYVMRWSDIRTWGTDMPPIDGDLVFVPPGMNLLVDQSTPILEGILVQNGTLTFADQSDMVVQAGFITVVGGKFLAGTQDSPYQHQLKFIMHGDYYGAQAPMFGNKGIGCLECFLSMHGRVRPVTWTSLAATASPGTASITVQNAGDWAVGQQIVIASTSFNHYQAERRTITAVAGNTLTLNASLKYNHFSGVQTYGSDSLKMRAEVGLLTRNIKMSGDDESQMKNYGSHLMLAGSAENGLVGHIGYTEFYNCGQPRIIGRYCIHFHMNGDVSESFARGNAVHDSMARVITLHGIHFLTVEYNVGYNVKGHNYFVEDGIQTHNLIQYNLAVSSIMTFFMLQTDISVASFWITHPTNHFRFNHAAGSDFYGFWYEIKPHPDGPSATGDVCPMGNALGESHDNVAHSNVRFGLRIFKLTPRTYPCSDIYVQDEYDPWQFNPPVVGVFSNYILYKNGESGLLAQQTGNLIFTNITSAQNKRAGAEFYITEFTPQPVKITDSVLIGQTRSNDPQSVSGSKGIITPRLGNIRIDHIRFYNYPAGTHSLETCSGCESPNLFTNTAQEIYISNVSYSNVTGYKLFMNGLKREILYDLDGSFTTTAYDGTQRSSAAITANYKHLAAQPACKPPTDSSQWDNTLACDNTVKVARVTFSALKSSSLFSLVGLKAQEIGDAMDVVDVNSTAFTEIYSFFSLANKMDSMNSPKTYAMPYIAGRIYNIWWLTGLDFDGLQMTSSSYLKDTDPAVLFKFNYTLNREAFDIGAVRPHYPLAAARLFYPQASVLDPLSCQNGHYFHENDPSNRTLQLCASGLNRTYFQTTSVTAIYCRYLCPAPPEEFVKEDFVRYWSNASQWPEGRMPLPGQNVTVSGNWTIIMDVDPAPCGFMQIDGDVIIEDKGDRNVTCDSIWIRAGSLTAGSQAQPFTHQITIQLNGQKNDPGYTFDPAMQGNKIFLITGKLTLYGSSPSTVFTKLTQSIFPGATSLTVQSSAGWAVGDTLVLSPSFSASGEYQRVEITAVNGSTITFSPAVSFVHYGAADVTISNEVGELDTRTSVGHVTRNIKFVSGPDEGWGYTIVVYQMWDDVKSRTGVAVFDSVEFALGGHYDTEAASLNLLNNGDSSSGVTLVQKSSFSFCRSFCVNAVAHSGAVFLNNVFYEARKYHFRLNQILNFNIDSNLMVGAVSRPTMVGSEPIACVELMQTNPATDVVSINNNVCQGSAGNGFVLPFVSCGQMVAMPFGNNTAGSISANGFLLDRGVVTDTCIGFAGVKAYACAVGQIASPPGTTELRYSNYMMADNKLGLSLRFGLAGTDRSAFLSDSYFTAISRPTCSQCYSAQRTSCSGSQAIKLLAVTVNGERYPTAFGTGFDGLCKEEVLDSKAFLTNVVFQNYRRSYNESALAACANNILFRNNGGAPDLIGSAYLWDSSCSNCDFDSMAYFDAPKSSELGWFGGCGDMLCTGRNNYLIQDFSGTLFPESGVLLANNSWIGQNTESCSFKPLMNGYFCTLHEFAVLEYQSIAPDYNTRIMWPVSLKFDGGNWTSYTNGFKEWAWSGSEPLNKRLGRFVSTVRMFQYYNMTFRSNPPDDMRFQLQKRTPGGNNSDWIVARVYYPFPNMIEVQVNGQTIRPISLLDNNGEGPVSTTTCGSNKFYYFNRTIEFVVTGAADCLVRVSLTNSIQLTLHFAMNINDFYSADGTTRLVDRVCAVFGIIDQSRVKIVSVYTGSVQATLMISAALPPESESTSAEPAIGLAEMIALQKEIDATIANGTLASELQKDRLSPLLVANTALIPLKPVSEEEASQSEDSGTRTKVLIGVGVAVGLAVIVTIIVVIWMKKRVSNKVHDQLPAISEDSVGPKGKAIHVENTEENISELVIDH